VFTYAGGSPLDPEQVYKIFKIFKRLIRRHGLPEVPLHHLRHGSASLQKRRGVDIAVISKRLGHSKISLTSDTYGHLMIVTITAPDGRGRPQRRGGGASR
jgi:integrase